MNISNQIIEVIDALCDKFGIAMDWSSENLIPYAEILGEKIIKYEIWTSVFWIAVVLIPCILSWVVSAVTLKSDDSQEVGMGVAFGAVCITGISIFIIGFQIHDIITASVFPEMTIYNVISNLLQ